MKIILTDKTVEQVFASESKLDYKSFTFKEGDKINLNGNEITFAGFNRNPNHIDYTPEAKDIAVSAMMSVVNPSSDKKHLAQPVYFIRESKPMNLKDEIEPLGLHFRFTNIDPKTQTITLFIAQSSNEVSTIPFRVATNSFRTDYIVLEAILFPGINLVWAGTIMMMFGLAVSMMVRIREKYFDPTSENTAQ